MLFRSVPEDELGRMEVLVREAMEGAVQLSIPLRVSIAIGRDWGELS